MNQPPSSRRTSALAPEEPLGAVAPPERPTILLADDDDDLRALVALMLRRNGYHVVEARNGEHLLQLIQAFFYSGQKLRAPELILSDVRMPGWSGLEVLDWLRGSDRLTPVILFTAFGSDSVHRAAVELGATDVLDKPFDLRALERRVREVVPHA
jgi:CheY-like chemotaxis protein